jgi:nucleoside-diphosphate-sugar epimerase
MIAARPAHREHSGMRILIVGANGFIGRRIVQAVIERYGVGAAVAGVRQRVGPGSFAPGMEQRIVDVTDATSFPPALDGISHVIGSVMGSDAAMIAAAERGAAAAASGAIVRFVHLSSIAVHGAAQGTVSEAAPADTERGIDGYAAAKLAAERAVRQIAPATSVILRPGLVYGPGSALWTGRIAELLRQGRLGTMGARGEGTCALVHVDDVADAAVTACIQPEAAGRAFHLVAAPAPSWNEYLDDFARALGVPSRSISPFRLNMEAVAAYPLRAWQIAARRLGLSAPAAITPGLTRLFGQHVRYDSAAVPILLPGWRDYGDAIVESARWVRDRAG